MIKNKKQKTMQSDRCGNIPRQKCAKGRGKEIQLQEVMDRYKTNVQTEV